MARKLDPKAITARIKENKAIMKASKKDVTDSMNAAVKGGDIDAADTRKALASFIKASSSVIADAKKLDSLKGE